jgi:hypothetical protein
MKMFEIIEQQKRRDFAGIITEDESWFFSSIPEIVHGD